MIIEIFQTGALDANNYLLIDEDSKEAVLIDLGGDFDRINQVAKEHCATLKYVLNTHGHFDHIMGELSLKQNGLNIPVYMHEADKPHADNIGASMKRWGIADSHPPIPIDGFIDENSELSLGNKKIKVIHTPGHSKGGVCYFIDNNLFSGDTLFLNSIGRSDFEDGNYLTLIQSITEKLIPLGDEIKVYPGHGPATTIEHEKKYNSFLK